MYAQAKAKRWQRKGGVARSVAELPSGQPAVALGGASSASSVAEPQRCCGKRSTNLTTKVLEGLFKSLTSLRSQISKQVSRRQMIFQTLSYNSRSVSIPVLAILQRTRSKKGKLPNTSENFLRFTLCPKSGLLCTFGFVRTLCSDKTSQKTAKIVVRFRSVSTRTSRGALSTLAALVLTIITWLHVANIFKY